MASLKTKLLFAQTFAELAETRPVEQISVSDLVEATGKNRKTFYYHFSDKRELIAWTFRYDLAEQLRRRVGEEDLVYQEQSRGLDSARVQGPDRDRDYSQGREAHGQGTADCSALPYYTHIRVGIRSLDAGPFYRALAATLESRPAFYRQVMRPGSASGLGDYLFALFEPALRRDIDFMLGGRHLEDSNKRFLSEFYTGAFIGYLTRRLVQNSEPLLAEVGPFENVIQSSIAEEIRKQQKTRSL